MIFNSLRSNTFILRFTLCMLLLIKCKYINEEDSAKTALSSVFYLCLPRKNRANVPGPEWDPMTAPT